MNTQTDLFPETLLVEVSDGKVYTTSLNVAEHFGKRHKNVLRLLESLRNDMPEAFWRLNFEPRDYTDMRGKTYPMFELSHDGFALLAMSFTGKAALEWKIRFLEAFRAMERQLAEHEARYARALDAVRPFLRPVVEATERGESRTVIGERLDKSANAVTYHRRRARELGLLDRNAA